MFYICTYYVLLGTAEISSSPLQNNICNLPCANLLNISGTLWFTALGSWGQSEHVRIEPSENKRNKQNGDKRSLMGYKINLHVYKTLIQGRKEIVLLT